MSLEISRPRLPALTSLRFFAAMHVVFFHFQAMKIMTRPGWFHDVASIGYVGVSFFFVLSGFILVYTYAGRSTTAVDFWRARFARVYPAYLFSLLLTAPFFLAVIFLNLPVPFLEWAKHHVKLSALLEITLLQAWVPPAALVWNAVAWSLSVEAFFYLVFPFLLKAYAKLSRPQLAVAGVAAWLATMAMTSAYVLRRPDGLAYVDSDTLQSFWLNVIKFNPLARLPEFLVGMACGFLFLRSKPSPKLAFPLVLAGLVGFGAVAHYSAIIPYPILHTSLLVPVFAFIVFGFVLQPKWAFFLNWRPMILLGDASYSLYLLHSTVVGMFFFGRDGTLHHDSPLGILGAILIALTLSLLVYLLIEQPARRWLRGKPTPKQAALPDSVAAAGTAA